MAVTSYFQLKHFNHKILTSKPSLLSFLSNFCREMTTYAVRCQSMFSNFKSLRLHTKCTGLYETLVFPVNLLLGETWLWTITLELTTLCHNVFYYKTNNIECINCYEIRMWYIHKWPLAF